MAVLERKIVEIDKEKCNGCGLCVAACHEAAIRMVNGKAELVSDIYCDGLGDCLGPCPTGAISIVTRPAEIYDEAAVAERVKRVRGPAAQTPHPGGCPGMAMKTLKPPSPPAGGCPGAMARALKPRTEPLREPAGPAGSELMNWPVQLRLVPPSAPYLKGADILLAADCAAVAVPDFHARYLRNRPVIIACPKLEENGPQIEKLAAILEAARPNSLTVVRMEVPCCGGLARVAEEAKAMAGVDVPLFTIVVGTDGGER